MRSDIIVNRERASQLLAFDGLEWGKCKCTDIDVSLDFQGKTFVFVEMKGKGAQLTLGQKLHLQALVKGLRAGGRTAFAVIGHHDTPSTDDDVHVAEAKVWSVYAGGRGWYKPEAGTTVKQFIDIIHEEHTSGLYQTAP